MPFGLFAFTFEGLAAIIGPIALITVLSAVLLIFVDRICLKFISLRKLNLLELIITITVFVLYIYSNTNLTVNITNPNINYLLVIENPGNLKSDKLKSAIPNNMKISTNKNYVIVEKMPDEVEYTTSADWNGNFYYNIYEFEQYKSVHMFSKNKMKINENFIDSLLNEK